MESKKNRGFSQKPFSEGGYRKKRRGPDGPRSPVPASPNRSSEESPSGQGVSLQKDNATMSHGRGRPPQRRNRSGGPKDQGRHQSSKTSGTNPGRGKDPNHSKNSRRDASESEAQQAAKLAAIEAEERQFKHVPRKYGVIVFDTLAQAHQDQDQIRSKADEVDQLNVVIRAEANMDDPVLVKIPKVKVFAGTAWALIHDRRIADGWYDGPR